MIKIREQLFRMSSIPELDLAIPMGDGAVCGVRDIVKEIVKLRTSIHRKPVVAGVVPGPVGQEDSGANA